MTVASPRAWHLRNRAGLEVRIGSLGAALMSVWTPDRHGGFANIVLGSDDIGAYADNPDYVGVVVGRFANRIGDARFDLDGRTHRLDANDGRHCLHGGEHGWHQRHWHGEATMLDGAAAVRLALISPDGDGGFPGQIQCHVTYALTEDDRLIVDYRAESNAPTPFNPTQHSYWNLSGEAPEPITDHVLMVAADHWQPVDSGLIPTGPPVTVFGTPFDFTMPRRLGDAFAAHAGALAGTGGYDHCLLPRGSGLRTMATLANPASGRVMTVTSDRPAIQLYTGQHLGPPHGPFAGIALETQMPPDAPNQPWLGNSIVRPGAPFHSRTIYAFATQER